MSSLPTPDEALHPIVIVAGTFDILHDGHYLMLHAAFSHGAFVEVWLSDDAMCAAKALRCNQRISSWASRSASVAAWIDDQTESSVRDFCARAAVACGAAAVAVVIPRVAVPYAGRHAEFELHDTLGPAATEARYTAIVCSQETREGVDAVNANREAMGLIALTIIEIPMWLKSTGDKLSSTLLRAKAHVV